MPVTTRFVLLKLLVLGFFVVLVLAPITAWVMSLPMWAMDVLGYLLSSPYHTEAERWFRAGLVVAGVPSLIAVAWRAREDRDFDMGVMTAVAALIVLVVLIAHYRWAENRRGEGEKAVSALQVESRAAMQAQDS
ncbi:hypothetical protein [Lysobacter sp. CA199]|uniref:hypothetical protein n=1 Tax=Lysobacter sp. CA199 TaxID=3455608 RepID=UPI003F8D693A